MTRKLTAALLSATLLSGCALLPEDNPVQIPVLIQPVEITYVTEPVVRMDLENVVDTSATVQSAVVTTLSYDKRGGTIGKIHVRRGDPVKEGDLLIELENENILKNIEAHQETLDAAQKKLAEARLALEDDAPRFRALLALEKAKLAYASAQEVVLLLQSDGLSDEERDLLSQIEAQKLVVEAAQTKVDDLSGGKTTDASGELSLQQAIIKRDLAIAALDKARADLLTLEDPAYLATQLQTARLNFQAAAAKLQDLEASLVKEKDPLTNTAVVQAQATLRTHQTTLYELTAQMQSSQTPPTMAQIEKIQNTNLLIQQAQLALEKARAAVADGTATIALELQLIRDRDSLAAIKTTLDLLESGDISAALLAQQQTVLSAQKALETAEAEAARLSGTSDTSDLALRQAQVALDAAKDKLSKLERSLAALRDPTQKGNTLNIATIDMNIKQQDLIAAQRTYDQLGKGEFDTNYQQALSTFTAAERRMAELKEELEATRLYAPHDGEVYDLTTTAVGAAIAARTMAVRIADSRPENLLIIYTQAFSSAYLDRVRSTPGMTTTITLPNGSVGQSFTITNPFDVGALVSLTFRNTRLGEDFEIPGVIIAEPDNIPAEHEKKFYAQPTNEADFSLLYHGLSVKINILLAKKDNALAVPRQSVFSYDGRYYVRLLKDGVRVERPVELGMETTSHYEILSGVDEGDLVILK